MGSRFRWLASCVTALLVLLLVPVLRADSRARIVRLSYTLGDVQVNRGQGWEKAILNMPILEGMQLKTGADSRAEVEFEEGSTVRLGPDSQVNFSRLVLLSSGSRATTVDLPRGTAFVDFRHKRQDEFDLDLGGRSLPLTHNTHFRAAVTPSQVELAVFKGNLELQEAARKLKVKKNETLTLNLSQPDSYELAKGISADSLDNWDTNRERYQSQYGGSYGSVPSYGTSDLSYYGTWIDSPMFGSVWRPYYVGYNWDPFWNGAWSWYPGFGYTWVSTYPWGWTPYRYGSWVFVPAYGWAWQPGNTWTTWRATPVIVNPPANYHMPVAPVGPTTPRTPAPTVMVNNTPPTAVAPMRPAPTMFRGFSAEQRIPRAVTGAPAAGVPASTPAAASTPGVVRPSAPRGTDRGFLTPRSSGPERMGGFHSMPGAYGRGAYGGARGMGSRPAGAAPAGPRSSGGGSPMGGGGRMGGGGGAHAGSGRVGR